MSDALTKGLADIFTFNCGLRPLLNERSVIGLVLQRFNTMSELTGRRRYFVNEWGALELEVERSEFVDGKWENNWFVATPDDVPGETIVTEEQRA